MDIIGRKKTLMMATACVWTGFVLLYFLNTFLTQMMAYGFATGCIGAYAMLFIFGMNEATGNFFFFKVNF
jgi:hypothetical protein